MNKTLNKNFLVLATKNLFSYSLNCMDRFMYCIHNYVVKSSVSYDEGLTPV